MYSRRTGVVGSYIIEDVKQLIWNLLKKFLSKEGVVEFSYKVMLDTGSSEFEHESLLLKVPQKKHAEDQAKKKNVNICTLA